MSRQNGEGGHEFMTPQEQQSIEELLFEVDRIEREDLPYIKLWPKEQGIASEERVRREEVVQRLWRQFQFCLDTSLALHAGRITLADIEKDSRFVSAQKTLKELINRTDLETFLDARRQEHELAKENGGEINPLLPNPDFNIRAYTKEDIAQATDNLVLTLEDHIGPDIIVKKDLEVVSQFLHDPAVRAYALEHVTSESTKAVESPFDFLWIKTKEPAMWEALCRLVRDKEVVFTILGKLNVNYDSGIVLDTKGEMMKARAKEMQENLPNLLHIALYNSVAAVADAESNATSRQAHKDLMKEFYSTLPKELEYEAEAMILKIEIGKIMESLSLEMSKQDRVLMEKGLELLLANEPLNLRTNLLAKFFITSRSKKFDWARFTEVLQKQFEEKSFEKNRDRILNGMIATAVRFRVELEGIHREYYPRDASDVKDIQRIKDVMYPLLKFINTHRSDTIGDNRLSAMDVYYLEYYRNHDHFSNRGNPKDPSLSDFRGWMFASQVRDSGLNIDADPIIHRFYDCNFKGVDFRFANFSCLDFSGTRNLESADFRGAEFYYCKGLPKFMTEKLRPIGTYRPNEWGPETMWSGIYDEEDEKGD